MQTTSVLFVIGWGVLGLILAPLVHTAIMAIPGTAKPLDGRARNARRTLIAGVLAAVLALLAARRGPTWVTVVFSFYTVVLVIIAGIDMDHRLILNRVVVPVALAALLLVPTLPSLTFGRAILGAAAGFGLLLLPALVMPGGLGGGDVKLAGLLGLMTGFPTILSTLALGIVLGGLTTLVLLLARRIGRRDYIPYGPFLVAGALLALVWW